MCEKLKVGFFSLCAFVDAPLASEELAKIFGSIAKGVLKEGKPLLPHDVMEVKVHFKYNPDDRYTLSEDV